MTRVRTEVVTDTSTFRALRDQWNALVDASAVGSIALTWEWLFTWWEVFGDGRSLYVVLVFEGDELIGIAPLQLSTVRQLSVPLHRLAFLASGEDEADEICSDYLDVIAARGQVGAVVAAVYERVAGEVGWDELRLGSVRAESPLPAALHQLAACQGLAYELAPRADCVEIALPPTSDAFLGELSAKLRAQIRRHRRLLHRRGSVEFRRISDPGDLEASFPQFVGLHQAWWTSRHKPGCFSSEKFLRFHLALSRRLSTLGRVNLHLLTVNDQPVAARYSFAYKGVVFEYQTGIDPRFEDSRIGLGSVCTACCIEDAIARGMTTYDFGEGVQDYKLRWSRRVHSTVNVRISRPSMKTSLRDLTERGEGALRMLTRRLQPPKNPAP